MQTSSITASTNDKARIQGFALVAVLTALMLSLFLEALDQTVVGTAMPKIIAHLHGMDRYSWVVTIYILSSMSVIPIVGKLSDQFGRKWFLLAGTALFLAGSLLAGAAQTMDQLIIFRGLQGLGAGIGIALIATVMADLFPPEERAKWSGLFGLVYGVASLLGPTLGGWFAEHGPLLGSLITDESRWRWVFYVNIPFGVIAIIALLFFLPANASQRTAAWTGWSSLKTIDFPGAILCAIATSSIILGLTWGSERVYAWNSLQVTGILATGSVFFVLFLFAERRAVEPILPLGLFRSQIFSAGAILSLLQNMVLLGLSLYLPLFFQGVLAISPTTSGLIMTPFSISMVVGAMLASAAANMLKRYQIVTIAGALIMSLGTFLIMLMTPQTNPFIAILFMIVAGLGIGPFFTLPMLAVQNAMPASSLGVTTAALRYLGQMGAILGIAIVGTVVTSSGEGNLFANFTGSMEAKMELAGALQHGFGAVLIFTIIALIAAFFLKDIPFAPKKEQDAPEGEQEEKDGKVKEEVYVS